MRAETLGSNRFEVPTYFIQKTQKSLLALYKSQKEKNLICISSPRGDDLRIRGEEEKGI